MYAVVFRAKINILDEIYAETAQRMRELAINKYGCTNVISALEGDTEITVSYWDSLEQITNWKEDTEHLAAQALGKNTWYQSYEVQIMQILRQYSSSN